MCYTPNSNKIRTVLGVHATTPHGAEMAGTIGLASLARPVGGRMLSFMHCQRALTLAHGVSGVSD